MDFGGRRPQGRKPSVDQAYLRAATVALWVRYPAKRAQLVSQSRTLIGIGTKAKLQKLVENFHARHDVNIESSGSPLSIHWDFVKDLIDHHGYSELKNFA